MMIRTDVLEKGKRGFIKVSPVNGRKLGVLSGLGPDEQWR